MACLLSVTATDVGNADDKYGHGSPAHAVVDQTVRIVNYRYNKRI